MATASAVLHASSIMPSLTVDDIDKTVAFYEALGFTVSDRWEENGKLTGASVKAGALEIGLSQDDWKKGRDRQKGIGMRLYIETADNIDQIAARAKAAGLTLDAEPSDTPYKTRQFELTDPSGFKVSISSPWPRN